MINKRRSKAFVGLRLAQLPSERLDGRRGVDAREEHKEERRNGRGLLQRGLHVEGRLLNEVLAQVVDHELRQRGADTSHFHNKIHLIHYWSMIGNIILILL